MNRRRANRFNAGFAAAIIMVLLVGGMCYFTLRRQAGEVGLIMHTYKVLDQANLVQQLMIDMETGRRGFRCTGDKVFLEPYYRSQPRLAPALVQLKELTVAPAQLIRAETLEKSVLRADSLWKTIDTARIYADAGLRKTITGTEKTLMDRVRDNVNALVNGEHDLLVQRETAQQGGINLTLWTLVGGITLILIVVIALIRLILSEFRTRVAAQDALKDKLASLQATNEETQQANWLLGGMREINISLIGCDSVQLLAQSCLEKIVDYTGAPAVHSYFYDAETHELRRMAGLALPPGAAASLKINEGITGHAATVKEMTVINNIPPDYWKIQSAAGGARPDTIICLPLWQKKELQGVIELAYFNNSTKRVIQLLETVADNIAIAVDGANSTSQTANLLVKVQEQKEELESQQEELRQTNEELTHQAQVLRASEEELKTQEEELRQINAELAEKTRAIELAGRALAQKADELEISSRYKSEFLANMSHELRTPLNSVLILANLLKDNKKKNLDDKQVEYARIIHKSGSDLLNLINDILDLSKIEAGKVDIFIEPVRIKEMAADMDQLFMVMANEKRITFAIDVAADMPEFISTDKQRLEQVIKNLLSNAFKFTPANGRISLCFALDGGQAVISVQDSGIGISDEKQQLIFEAFQQADGSTSRKFGGTGLGLSISKELMKRLKGEIKLRSTPGEGSTFTLMLPQHNSDEAPAPPVSAVAPFPVPAYPQGKVKEQTQVDDNKDALKPGEQSVLIIEDDPVFAGYVNDFAHGKGYKTIVAASGDEGIFYARRYKPAAIILDLGLPVIDGRNVLKILKSEEDLKNIPVHVVSAEDRTNMPVDIASYLQKPLKTNDLEKAFSNIDSYIRDHYKVILILSPGAEPWRKMFDTLTAEKQDGVMYDIVQTAAEALQHMANKEYDCIVADIGSSIQEGIATLQELKNTSRPDTYIITCLEGDISSVDEKQLKRYSDTIIRKSVQATSRLLDEVELFLHKIKNTQPVAVPAQAGKEFDKSLRGRKVLLADDDMRNVFALTSLLEEQGMDVIAAENGVEALEMLAQNTNVDIVLMDIMMPEMDGYETMRRIRAEKRYAGLPMIALTAKAMTGDREKCIEAGASDYITKPIDNNKLFSLMRVWLSK